MIWRNGKSHLEPSLLTDVITKLENFVNSRLQKVAFKYNAVYSQGSFDAISTRSSHTVETLCPVWMVPCSVPSRRSSRLSLGPGPHARAGGPRSRFLCGPCRSWAPSISRLPPWTCMIFFLFLSTCFYILSDTTLLPPGFQGGPWRPISCAIFWGRVSYALKIHPKYKLSVVR